MRAHAHAESWETAKTWTDALLPDVRRHLAEQLISVGTEVEDLRENTDLRVLCGRDHRIAVRLRTADVFRRWPDDISFRWAVRSGATTEFAKMMSGWGDLFFYGFADDHRSRFTHWRLIDLHRLRPILRGATLPRPVSTRAGDAQFLAIGRSLYGAAVVAESRVVAARPAAPAVAPVHAHTQLGLFERPL